MTAESDTQQEIPMFAGQRPDGESVFENLKVCALSEANCYRVLTSPAFSKGLAKGDEIRLLDAGHFEIIKHSGNLCVRVFARQEIEHLQNELTPAVKDLGGSLDLQNERLLVYSIPVAPGFNKIEACLNRLVYGESTDTNKSQDNAAWLYGNVYDPSDGTTALNWWQAFLKDSK